MIGLNKITVLPASYYPEGMLPDIARMMSEDMKVSGCIKGGFGEDYFGVFFVDEMVANEKRFRYLEN